MILSFTFVYFATAYPTFFAPWNAMSSLELPMIDTIRGPIHITDPSRRLVFIGDVHGCYSALEKLINKKIGGLDNETTLVLLGDIVTKGPDSEKVVDFILKHKDNVKLILGNNDVLVFMAGLEDNSDGPNVLMYDEIGESFDAKTKKLLNFTSEVFTPTGKFGVPTKKHRKIAKKLGVKRLQELARLGSIVIRFDLNLTNETLFSVHAGILPGDFVNEGQIPSIESLLNMKYVNKEDWSETARAKEDVENPIRWYKLWKHPGRQFENTTVLYGHDSGKGLNLRKHTYGLDTNCVSGGQLTAMEYKYDTKAGRYTTSIHQVSCD